MVAYNTAIRNEQDIHDLPWSTDHKDIILFVYSPIHEVHGVSPPECMLVASLNNQGCFKISSDYQGRVTDENISDIRGKIQHDYRHDDSKHLLKEKKSFMNLKKNMWMKPPGKNKGKNKGERGETRIVNDLFTNRDNPEIIKQIFGIYSRIRLRNPKDNTIINETHLTKWKGATYCKADIIVEFIDKNITKRPSIKCFDGAGVTLLNHTRRSAKCFQGGGDLAYTLPTLDRVIKIANQMRRDGLVTEDIPFSRLESNEEIMTSDYDVILEIVRYFTFTGTGNKVSECEADSLLIVYDSAHIGTKSTFVDCDSKEAKDTYIRKLVPHLRLSIRSGKGMPNPNNLSDIEVCHPWYYESGTEGTKGALHVRYMKSPIH